MHSTTTETPAASFCKNLYLSPNHVCWYISVGNQTWCRPDRCQQLIKTNWSPFLSAQLKLVNHLRGKTFSLRTRLFRWNMVCYEWIQYCNKNFQMKMRNTWLDKDETYSANQTTSFFFLCIWVFLAFLCTVLSPATGVRCSRSWRPCPLQYSAF